MPSFPLALSVCLVWTGFTRDRLLAYGEGVPEISSYRVGSAPHKNIYIRNEILCFFLPLLSWAGTWAMGARFTHQ